MERKVLGRGLEALIPKNFKESPFNQDYIYAPLNKIILGKYQPRQEIDQKELEKLAQSIKEKGFIQPIVVRKIGEQLEIVAGYRRYCAAKLLGMEDVPVILRELDDKDTFILAILENLQREDLNPIEEALAFKRLIDEFGFTLEAIGKVVSKDKSWVANTLRLLKLPSDMQEAIRKKIITRTQARTLLSLNNEKEQRELFHKLLREGLSVRDLEKRVKRMGKPSFRKIDPFVLEMEEKFQKILGRKVRIIHKKNKGKIIIEYYSIDDLERLSKRIL
ncbi:MAG: ParB/RepB/Spo0J family partition protein [Candidatus Omnitrophica bacterium]|nr:ParB/RepB/Spo0J family partition protein [Candidatus Omnitrophota bacterium]MCM8825916.1 ParB/RepB/Spo0J family partition protein [Candidatus Omnitrophota bacterium]